MRYTSCLIGECLKLEEHITSVSEVVENLKKKKKKKALLHVLKERRSEWVNTMSHVNLKKWSYRHCEFRGQGPCWGLGGRGLERR